MKGIRSPPGLTMRKGISKNAMAQERMHARNGFRRIKHGRVRRDSVRSESRLRRFRDWLLRQRMRQRFKRSVVLEPEMRSFVPFDQGEDRRRVITSEVARCVTRCGLVQR